MAGGKQRNPCLEVFASLYQYCKFHTTKLIVKQIDVHENTKDLKHSETVFSNYDSTELCTLTHDNNEQLISADDNLTYSRQKWATFIWKSCSMPAQLATQSPVLER